MKTKVIVKNFWNGMNPSWRIGNEVEVDSKIVEGLVANGSVEMPKAKDEDDKPRRRG